MVVGKWLIDDTLKVRVEKNSISIRLFFDKDVNLLKDHKKLHAYLKENAISNFHVFVFRSDTIGIDTLRSQIKERVLSLEDFEVKEKV